MAVKTTAAGKMDKRTKEYKELKQRLAKARAAKTKTSAAKTPKSTLKKTKSGKVDKRTKEAQGYLRTHGKGPQGTELARQPSETSFPLIP